jgi:hypothetical protein
VIDVYVDDLTPRNELLNALLLKRCPRAVQRAEPQLGDHHCRHK